MDDVEEIIAWKKDVDMLISKLKAVVRFWMLFRVGT
jgi:hypothetical protein